MDGLTDLNGQTSVKSKILELKRTVPKSQCARPKERKLNGLLQINWTDIFDENWSFPMKKSGPLELYCLLECNNLWLERPSTIDIIRPLIPLSNVTPADESLSGKRETI